MYRNWKKVSALGLAVLIGCTLPMGTLLAAEDKAETVQEPGENSSVDNNVLHDDDTLDNGSIADNENTSGDESATDNEDNTGAAGSLDNENPSGDETSPNDEDIQDEVNTDNESAGDETGADNSQKDVVEGIPESQLPPIKQKAPALGTEAAVSMDAPEIAITWQGKDLTNSLGGQVSYEYINYSMQGFAFEVSASHAARIFYYLDKVTDRNDEAKGAEQMDSLSWTQKQSDAENISLLNDGTYVLYVKAEGDGGQVTYARSDGIVGDTQAPKVIGAEDGKAYPEGTVFQIEDDNLESVTINGKPVALSADGKYQVTANGTSCVIKAKDKAGNFTSCSIAITGKDPSEDGNVISKSGVYALKKGVSYQLSAGKWKISGDSSVYAGGNDFYVKADQNCMLIKY